MKSTTTAYVLWFFLGFIGAHKFYLEKTGMGLVYLFTFGLLGFGLLYDLFTLGSQVYDYNMRFNAMYNPAFRSPVIQNTIVNSNGPGYNNNNVVDELQKLKQLLDSNVITQEEFDVQKRRLMMMA